MRLRLRWLPPSQAGVADVATANQSGLLSTDQRLWLIRTRTGAHGSTSYRQSRLRYQRDRRRRELCCSLLRISYRGSCPATGIGKYVLQVLVSEVGACDPLRVNSVKVGWLQWRRIDPLCRVVRRSLERDIAQGNHVGNRREDGSVTAPLHRRHIPASATGIPGADQGADTTGCGGVSRGTPSDDHRSVDRVRHAPVTPSPKSLPYACCS